MWGTEEVQECNLNEEMSKDKVGQSGRTGGQQTETWQKKKHFVVWKEKKTCIDRPSKEIRPVKSGKEVGPDDR